MKKYFYLLVLSALFVGCSSSGSHEIQINEVQFIPNDDNDKIEEFGKVNSIFEVVPGKYEIAWNLVDDLPQLQNYDVTIKLKLRLKKSVDVKQEIFEKLTNADTKWVDFPHVPFEFALIDANGQRMEDGSSSLIGFNMSNKLLQKFRQENGTAGLYDRDKILDFYRFLKSKPGTEFEAEVIGTGLNKPNCNCIDDIKNNVKGIVCLVWIDDEYFENSIGKILE